MNTRTIDMLRMYKLMYHDRLQRLREFADYVKGFLSSGGSLSPKEVDPIDGGSSIETAEQNKMGILDERLNWEHIFPRMARDSIFVLNYSFFENQLNMYCRAFQKANSTLALKHLYGSGITKARIFFQEIMRIRIPASLENDGDLITVNKIRNLIIHNEGVISKKGVLRNVNALAEKIPTQLTDSEKKVVICWEFLHWTMDEMEKCSNCLLDNIRKAGLNMAEPTA